ncbi:MAG: pseudouridine synthase [Lachnospiraceae bacterium]|nr:pseudouridine synthase [Lachnospiraceae bacterium]MEE3461640.1 pseudouridine synthase [Lachnospiraceae bacterium]
METRLNKYLSEAGYCSRREADRLIDDGRIYVNGIPAIKGQKVNESDDVSVDGKKITHEIKPVVIAFYKPRGIVSTTAEEENGEKIVNVVDYIGFPVRIYPVGRLDRESEGLLLLTNQGELMDLLLRSRYGHEKEYYVRVNRTVTADDIRNLSNGIHIVDKEHYIDRVTKKCTVKKVSDDAFRIVLTEGINRQIRRMCEYCGMKVITLRRERVMNITLDGLKPGRFRELEADEITELKHALGLFS